jgi:hypothetical protein
MFDGQIEMSFGKSNYLGRRRYRSQNRAHWWFERMRQIVDLAIEWQPTPPPRPVQIWFPAVEARFSPKTNQKRKPHRVGADEHLICE